MFRIADAEIAEALLWHLWNENLPKMRPLRLSDGRTVRIMQTGVLNEDAGPDFLGAELSFGPGQPVVGDVEIHVRPVDWRRHGHHQDLRYNSVLLHVVLWSDTDAPQIVKQNGQYLPTLVLAEHLRVSLDILRKRFGRHRTREYPCQTALPSLPIEKLHSLLNAAGDARLSEKATAIEKRLSFVSEEQALYECLMRAVGYSKNTDAFLNLSRLLPVSRLRAAVAGLPPENQIVATQALLFGAAGLLPLQTKNGKKRQIRQDTYLTAVDSFWRTLSPITEIRAMQETDWKFFRLRPFNFPTVRLAGMAYLINRGTTGGISSQFVQAATGQTTTSNALQSLKRLLEALLRPCEEDYFMSHTLLGGEESERRTALIGGERRREMIVNSVLPFLVAVARRTNDNTLLRTVLEIFAEHPTLPDNETLRQMKTVLFLGTRGVKLDSSARLQQGLLHIEAQTCREKNCHRCVLRPERLSEDV